MTKKYFVDTVMAWLLKYHPHAKWISKHEDKVKAFLGKIFNHIDKDKNGTVSKAELTAAIAQHKKARAAKEK